jgi:hypothetical protein
MPRDKTTVEVGTDTWSGLNQLKGPGDSFDSVIRRLLSLNGVDVEQPDKDEGYVAGDVVLARINPSNGDKQELRPHLILRETHANEGGNYEIVRLTNLNWGPECTTPTARAYLNNEDQAFLINDDKVVRLEELQRAYES